MQPDVTDLLEFYARPLGAVARRIVAQRIRARWRHCTGATVVGLGFATPYLGSFRGEAARLMALMPTTQGAVVWPASGPVMTAVVETEHLPLPDNTVDYLLAVHALEVSGNIRGVLREIWRVLKPDGRLLLVVPNRRGVWARLDHTPFGHGQPFSAGQVQRLLEEALFTPLDIDMALYMPPIERRLFLKSAATLERIGRRVTPLFAGLVVVEARKELIAPVGKAVAARGLKVLAPIRGTTFTAERLPPKVEPPRKPSPIKGEV